MSRDGLNLGAQFLFNFIQIKSIVPADQIDCKTKVAKSTRTTNPMKIGFSIFGEIKVNDNINSLNIDASSKQVGAHQVSATAIAKLVENAVTICLDHLGVRIKA